MQKVLNTADTDTQEILPHRASVPRTSGPPEYQNYQRAASSRGTSYNLISSVCALTSTRAAQRPLRALTQVHSALLPPRRLCRPHPTILKIAVFWTYPHSMLFVWTLRAAVCVDPRLGTLAQGGPSADSSEVMLRFSRTGN